jgi:hypothetical protein
MTLTIKAGIPRNRTGSGRRLKRKARRRAKLPWNKGKLGGSKPPLRTKDVWSILTKPQVEERTRDSVMFNLTIHSKLRSCNVVRLKVEDVARMA